MNKGIIGILLIGSIMISCNRSITRLDKKDLIIDEITFDYLSARTKVKYDDGKKDISGTANIRMAYDSLIWMSITPGLGVEVARLMITRDSIYFMDRINKKFKIMGYEEIENTYKFDLNFNMIQSLILGNLLLPYSRQGLKKQPDGYSYQQKSEDILVSSFIGLDTRKLERFDATDLRNDNSISVNYGNFKAVGEEMIPYSIVADFQGNVASSPRTSIEIGYTKAEIEEQSLNFPFSIPSKYTSY
jgi:hypothetical protein